MRKVIEQGIHTDTKKGKGDRDVGESGDELLGSSTVVILQLCVFGLPYGIRICLQLRSTSAK